jgi:DNA-binding LacI/PurR family transcriptional regulator
LLQHDPPLTAICANVLGQAIGALAALWQAGRHVPDDVSLVSFDDLPLADYLRPALTRVRVPLGELGAAGVDAAIDQLLGAPPADVTVGLDMELVERGSTAPPNVA